MSPLSETVGPTTSCPLHWWSGKEWHYGRRLCGGAARHPRINISWLGTAVQARGCANRTSGAVSSLLEEQQETPVCSKLNTDIEHSGRSHAQGLQHGEHAKFVMLSVVSVPFVAAHRNFAFSAGCLCCTAAPGVV
mmetsp:Transcript_90306/g.173797  ORF Transcript_90306/g.173797 Transcript_90306/m.173797 type:complete len:135 (-) Transcript_90306:285-689(-)